MRSGERGLDRAVAAFGLTQAPLVAARFAEVRAHFEEQFRAVHDQSEWKIFRDRWLGRKSGVLTQITDNWLKPATPELKRAVGASLNELRSYVEAEIEAPRPSIQPRTEEAPVQREPTDPSPPRV